MLVSLATSGIRNLLKAMFHDQYWDMGAVKNSRRLTVLPARRLLYLDHRLSSPTIRGAIRQGEDVWKHLPNTEQDGHHYEMQGGRRIGELCRELEVSQSISDRDRAGFLRRWRIYQWSGSDA